ncbi:hypothetical protein B566_EDAN016893, partial [Ephemera danica]
MMFKGFKFKNLVLLGKTLDFKYQEQHCKTLIATTTPFSTLHFIKMYKLLLLAVAIQVATSSVVQHQDALSFENNFETRVNPITEEKDMVIIDGKRYYFGLFDTTLYDAQARCEELGMQLVSFETQAKSDSVWAYIQSQGMNQWYYTNGVRVNSQFKWGSTYLNYNNWASGEPDETGATNQACIYYATGLFYDDNCSVSRHFICEDK